MKERLNYDDMVSSLLVVTAQTIKGASQTLVNRLPSDQQPKLHKVEFELHCFLVFALDYWWQTDIAQTQEQKSCFGETLSSHLGIFWDTEPTGQALIAVEERFITYGQIVNEKHEKNDYAAKLFRFSTVLSDHCDIPFIHFSDVVHTLFLTAMELVHELNPFRNSVSPNQ